MQKNIIGAYMCSFSNQSSIKMQEDGNLVKPSHLEELLEVIFSPITIFSEFLSISIETWCFCFVLQLDKKARFMMYKDSSKLPLNLKCIV